MKKIVEDTILAYIETHLDMEYGQDDIAEAFGYSTDHFVISSVCIMICLWESIYGEGGFSKQQRE